MESKDAKSGSAAGGAKDFIIKYGRRIWSGLLVITCIGLIIYFMPKEKSVYYDFKRDTPWAHEQLRAEFDFDVPKSEEEITAEEDSIRELAIPIFRQTG